MSGRKLNDAAAVKGGPYPFAPPPARFQQFFGGGRNLAAAANVNGKAVNPKDALASGKLAHHVLPRNVLGEAALGMMEGARKYGAHNWRRAGALASVQYNAAMRHLDSYWEGEDIDPASGIHHVAKAMSALMVLRDAQLRGACEDDRPPRSPPGWLDRLNQQAAGIAARFPNPAAPLTAPGKGRPDAT